MTKHECAVIMAFTGVAMLKGNELNIFYEYVAKILGRPVYTHEMAMLSEEIKEAARNDFVQLCRNASDEDKPLTNGDRIRQMTDEELAEFLEKNCSCPNCCIYHPASCKHIRAQCTEGYNKWLRKEVSEDAGTD